MSKTIAPSGRREKRGNAKTFDIDEVATDLILEHGAMILKDARRYSSCLADAEDAYQRSLVIMLTQAPSTKPEELVPWLRVVVRREAADIARTRQRTMGKSIDALIDARAAEEAIPEEHMVDAFDADLGIEALTKLKPDHVRCLLAQANGNTYAEIADVTGFSPRKVARCVNEGRRAFMLRVEEIESGTECARVDELLPQIADGDGGAIESARVHLKNCGGCRSAVRQYREAPRHATVLFPPTMLAASTATGETQARFDEVATAWHHGVERLNLQIHNAQQWLEIGTYKKMAAAAAITAAVATGGAAATHFEARFVHETPTHSSAPANARPIGPTHLLDEIDVAQVDRAPRHHPRHRVSATNTPQNPPPAKPPQPISSPKTPVGDGSSEFMPGQR